jgi:DNA-binding response OmpR family regulator
MKAMRARARMAPVLMLTARDTEDEIIRGLDLGADDYLTKPFSFPELVARLQSISRRPADKSHAMIEVGDVVVDLLRHTVTRNLKSIELTRTEFLLLACLVRRTGQCVPRQILMDSVWGSDHPMGPSTLDVLVNALRTKFDAAYPRKLIGTVRGSGYIFQHRQAEQGRDA